MKGYFHIYLLDSVSYLLYLAPRPLCFITIRIVYHLSSVDAFDYPTSFSLGE
jgi:hypothetical protein